MSSDDPAMSPELQAVRELLAGARETMATMSLAERRDLRDSLPQPLPEGTTTTPIDAGGVPGEWLARDSTPDRVILFLHGGGYVVASPRSHRRLAATIGVAVDADCLVVDFRRAPEHPFPAALDDAVASYRWLLHEVCSPAEVLIVGDSAGGGLAVALLLALRDAGEQLPAAAVLLSPWLDMTLQSESIRTRRDLDVSIGEELLRESVAAYAVDHPPADPLLSPLYGDLAGLPPVLAQVGDYEIVRDDAVRFVERASAAGVDATVEVWPQMPHVFHAFTGYLPEADQAIERIGAWARPHATNWAASLPDAVWRSGLG